jgi:tetratricopeptide (TPR) repeat protein
MDRRGTGFILANLADVCLRKDRLAEARGYLDQALEVGNSLGERIVVSDVKVLQGRLFERLGNTREADDHFLSAIRVLEEIEMPDRLRDCHMAYAQVLDERGDIASAARHWRLAAEIGKSAALGTSIRRLTDNRAKQQASPAS